MRRNRGLSRRPRKTTTHENKKKELTHDKEQRNRKVMYNDWRSCVSATKTSHKGCDPE